MTGQVPCVISDLGRHKPIGLAACKCQHQAYGHRLKISMTLHCCAAHNPATVARDVHKSLKNLMRVCKPGKSVIIAFDGPAPLAKIVEQRYAPGSEVWESQS